MNDTRVTKLGMVLHLSDVEELYERDSEWLPEFYPDAALPMSGPVILNHDVWEELGQPKEITVTIQPGNLIART